MSESDKKEAITEEEWDGNVDDRKYEEAVKEKGGIYEKIIPGPKPIKIEEAGNSLWETFLVIPKFIGNVILVIICIILVYLLGKVVLASLPILLPFIVGVFVLWLIFK